MSQPTDLYATPIGEFIDALQGKGRDVYIAGFTEDGTRCIIVDVDNAQVSTAVVGTCNGLGRWECNIQHYRHNSSLYLDRYPRRV